MTLEELEALIREENVCLRLSYTDGEYRLGVYTSYLTSEAIESFYGASIPSAIAQYRDCLVLKALEQLHLLERKRRSVQSRLDAINASAGYPPEPGQAAEYTGPWSKDRQ